MDSNRPVGSIELGGTKTVVAIGNGCGKVLGRACLPTIEPAGLIPQIATFFAEQAAHHGPIAALGVGAFGPIVIDPNAPAYGNLLLTNKPGWSGFDLASALETACGVKPQIITDVAAAGVGEARLGALKGVELGVYLTVGTGIGGAIICRGAPLPALLHPEMGHIALTRRADDAAPSACQFHDNCAEGLAAGPAIIARYGQSLNHFAPGSGQHQLVAGYLGQLCANQVLTLSPQRIVLGGGVAQAEGVVAATQQAMLEHLGPYASAQIRREDFICAPQLGQDAGIIGALCHAGEDSSARCVERAAASGCHATLAEPQHQTGGISR